MPKAEPPEPPPHQPPPRAPGRNLRPNPPLLRVRVRQGLALWAPHRTRLLLDGSPGRMTVTLAFQMPFHPPAWAPTHWLRQWATVSTHWGAMRMPAQTCEPLACTLTIHGHRRTMASGSLRVGSGSWEEPQTKEEEKSLMKDELGALSAFPPSPSFSVLSSFSTLSSLSSLSSHSPVVPNLSYVLLWNDSIHLWTAPATEKPEHYSDAYFLVPTAWFPKHSNNKPDPSQMHLHSYLVADCSSYLTPSLWFTEIKIDDPTVKQAV